MLGITGFTEKYNELKDSTYFKNFKAGVRFAIYYTVATFAVGCLGLIIKSPVLIFPLAMLISNPLVWIAMGIVSAVVYKKVAKPLFHSAKDFINKKRGLEAGVGEQKSQERSTRKGKLTRSVSANRIFSPGQDSKNILNRSTSLDSGRSSLKDGSSSQDTPTEARIRRASGASSEVKAYDTVGDGNCFFHAVFGKKDYTYRTGVYEDGVYRAERAQEMRKEWHKFLSQFTSLDDQRMPAPLREQMQKVFNMFLSKPGDLTGRSDEIKKLAEKVKDRIKEADTKTEELKKEIVKKFQLNSVFRGKIYSVINKTIEQRNSRNPHDKKLIPSVQELLDDKEKLYNEIQEDLESCTLVLNSNLSKKEYSNTYDPKVIKDIFLNDYELYRCYLEAIQNPGYYVFIEEIPILASLANIEIDVHYKNNNKDDNKVFKPKPGMINPEYQNNFPRNEKKHETVYLKPVHYERAEVVEVLPISKTESVSSLQSVLSYCPIM